MWRKLQSHMTTWMRVYKTKRKMNCMFQYLFYYKFIKVYIWAKLYDLFSLWAIWFCLSKEFLGLKKRLKRLFFISQDVLKTASYPKRRGSSWLRAWSVGGGGGEAGQIITGGWMGLAWKTHAAGICPDEIKTLKVSEGILNDSFYFFWKLREVKVFPNAHDSRTFGMLETSSHLWKFRKVRSEVQLKWLHNKIYNCLTTGKNQVLCYFQDLLLFSIQYFWLLLTR